MAIRQTVSALQQLSKFRSRFPEKVTDTKCRRGIQVKVQQRRPPARKVEPGAGGRREQARGALPLDAEGPASQQARGGSRGEPTLSSSGRILALINTLSSQIRACRLLWRPGRVAGGLA